MWLGYLRETFRTWSSGGKSTLLLFSIPRMPFTFPFFRLHLECRYSFAKALSNHQAPSQPPVGMQSFRMPWFHENTNSARFSFRSISSHLRKRFYIDIMALILRFFFINNCLFRFRSSFKFFLPPCSLKELVLIVHLHAERPCFIADARRKPSSPTCSRS